ncbi:hypothetical protein [Arthrobacter sp. RC1.1 241]|jgi:hypothetical protein|uniref:hypothetical protein n=1 Tax=Paenarthrobacter sp. 22069 TaxID=3453864 RepID=UPI000D7BB93E
METPDYARFVHECIAADAVDDHILSEDQFYGVYLSWCALQSQMPGPCESFWAAMSQLGIRERGANDDRCIRPGLRMTGPAALDYILASQPSLV